MRVSIENIGVIRYAEFEVGDLTVICGTNNTGKTYATYALYGFLDYFQNELYDDLDSVLDLDKGVIRKLFDEGAVSIDLQKYYDNADSILQTISHSYTSSLSRIFAADKRRFEESKFKVTRRDGVTTLHNHYSQKISDLISVEKESGSAVLTVTRLVEKEKMRYPEDIFLLLIIHIILQIIFAPHIPRAFISSVERTGASIFKQELLITRNRLLEKMGNAKKESDLREIFLKSYSRYPLPVSNNIKYIQELDTITTDESYIATDHPEILEMMAEIIGGRCSLDKEGDVNYTPNKGRSTKLKMVESSSIIRALVNIEYYLRYTAQKDDLLIVDEPELNLHPENQRKMARLFAMLVNAGIRVMITTHSDYILREFNNLILLAQDSERIRKIQKQYGYSELELLNAEGVRAYVAEKSLVLVPGHSRKTSVNTLTPTDVTPESGINMDVFDHVINEMNAIYDQIIWGE